VPSFPFRFRQNVFLTDTIGTLGGIAPFQRKGRGEDGGASSTGREVVGCRGPISLNPLLGKCTTWHSLQHCLGASMSVADFVGLVGVAAYLSAYGLLQLGKLKFEDWRYAFLNGIGALAILYSLTFDFNMPSFITQAMWLIFTIIGYLRLRFKRAPPQAI